MAVKTYYLGSGQDGNFGALFDGAAQTAANRADGWTVAKVAAPFSAEFDAGTKQLSTIFTSNATTPKPASFLTGTTANALKTPAALSGTFAATAWTFTFAFRSGLVSGQTGRINMRVYKSVNADGSSATELTVGRQVGTTTAVLSTSADVTSVVTWNPGATITLNNEFLFFVIAWEIVVASGSNSADVIPRTGSTGPAGTALVTPDFTASTILQTRAQSGFSGTTAATVWTGNCTIGSTHFAVVYWNSATATCSVADPNNGAWTPIGAPQVGAGGGIATYRLQMFVKFSNVTAGKPIVTATISTSVTDSGICLIEIAAGRTGIESSVYATSAAANPTQSLTPNAANAVMVAFEFCESSPGSSAGAGFTIVESANFASNPVAVKTAVTQGSANTVSWTSAAQQTILGMAVIGTAAAPVNTPVTLAATMTLTPVLTEVEVYKRTLAVTPSFSLAISMGFKLSKTVAATSAFVPAISRQTFYNRTFSVTSTFVPAISRQVFYSKTFAVASALTPALVKKLLAPRAISASTVLTPVMGTQKSKGISVPLTATLTPVISVKKSQGFIIAAVTTLTPALTRVPLLSRTFAVSANFTVTQVRKLSAFKTLAGTTALTPLLTRKSLYSRALNGAISFLPIIGRGSKVSRNFNASLVLNPNLDVGSGKAQFLNTVLVFTPALKKYVTKTLAAPLNFAVKYQRSSTTRMALTVTLTPAQGGKLSSFRTLASVAIFQVDLQRGADRKITFPVPLPFSAAMTAGRPRSVQLSASTIFTAALGFMRFLAQKPAKVLFSTRTEPAVLLGAEEQTGRLLYAEGTDKIELLSADGEIPELVSAAESKSDLKGVS